MWQIIKNIFRPDFRIICLCFMGVLVWCSGCISRTEGCLDIEGKNFDLEADRACRDCCTYPSMQLILTQKWGDRNFSTTDTLYDAGQRPYRITDLKLLLTSWSWSTQEGEVFTVDSMSMPCEDFTFRYTPDILLVDARQFTYTLGTVQKARQIATNYMYVGTPVEYSCLLETASAPTQITKSSPLWDPEEAALASIRMVIQPDINADQLDTIYIQDVLLASVELQLDMVKGFDTQLRLTIDYSIWWKDADGTDPASFGISLRQNFDNGVFQTP